MDKLVAMTTMADESTQFPDSPEARRYNRIRRWLGVTDFVVGFAFLILLLATGWSAWLRDLAYRVGFQNYSLSLFVYLLLLLAISKALGTVSNIRFPAGAPLPPLHRKISAWAWDEVKGFSSASCWEPSWWKCCT